MITDIFSRRYADVQIRDAYTEQDRRFLNQAAVMILDPLWAGQRADTPSKETEGSLKEIHDTLALEMGVQYLSDRFLLHNYTFNGNQMTNTHTITYANICKNFLTKPPPSDINISDDAWIKDRLSLVELAFKRRREQLAEAARNLPRMIKAAVEAEKRVRSLAAALKIPGSRADTLRASHHKAVHSFEALVGELNGRLREAGYPLNFHNGILQRCEDNLTQSELSAPFWSLVSSPQWASVDEQMKEALDRRDKGDRTAAFHAVCALESAVKIVSDVKGWTRGSEKGAAQYVDNLVSKKNGSLVESWEGEMLKVMFSDVRNPFAHGPGQAPMPRLSDQQTDWAIDTAMSWIKSLIRRV